MRRFSVCLPLCTLLVLVCIIPVYSETIVEGVASGVWEPLGNPYILEGDTIIVPPGSTLDIMPGTEIRFGDCDRFFIYGVISSTGTEEFPVRWETNEEGYCWVQIETATEDTNHFHINHICGEGNLSIFMTDCNVAWDSCRFDMNNNRLSFNVHRTCYYNMEDNIWYNTASGLYVDSNVLLLKNNRVEGEGNIDINIDSDSSVVQDNRFPNSELRIMGGIATIINNYLYYFNVQSGNDIIINNNKMVFLYIYGSHSMAINNNYFRDNIIFRNYGFQFFCEADHATISENRNIEGARIIGMDSSSEIKYNEFTSYVDFSDCDAVFNNNTLVLLDDQFVEQGRSILTCQERSRATIDNNIFVGVSELVTPNAIEVEDLSDVHISNNCFHRVGEPVTGDEAESSIIADPCFVNVGEGDYHLQSHSPCIDAGAEGYWDEDTSVADLGAFPFDNRENHSPTLASSHQITAVKGEAIQYTIFASDDGEALDISFSGLPGWLSPDVARSELDAVLDSVVLEGVVPQHATDSWVVVNMLSGDNEQSVDSLLVHVYEQRLSGELSGIISAADAPYLMDGDSWISAGDFVVFAPGMTVEVLEDHHNPISLDIHGDLLMQGNEGDSIVFRSASRYPGYRAWKGITLQDDPAETAFQYLVVEDADTGLSVATTERFNLRNSRFTHCVLATLVSSDDTCYVNHCEFTDNIDGLFFSYRPYSNGIGYLDSLLFRDTKSVAVDIPPGRLSNSRIEGGYGGIYQWLISVDNAEYEILNNYVADCKFGFLDFSTGNNVYLFKNNIFVNCYYIDFNGRPRTDYYLYNNTFYAPNVPRYSNLTSSWSNFYMMNNIFLCTDPPPFFHENVDYFLDYNLFSIGDYSMYGVGNIHADPIFHNAAAGDFHLMEGSPCIDTGDPTFPYDPDGTRADIGAISYDPDWVQVEDLRPLPTEDDVCPLYPNPFNGTTTVKINLADMADVQVQVFNLLGQRVGSYQWACLCGGEHRLHLDRQGLDFTTLASGVYFFRVELARAKGNEQYLLKAVHIK